MKTNKKPNRAVIIASGPSLTQEDVDYVLLYSDAYVMVINDTYRLAPWADALYACDYKWWNHYNGVQEFKQKKYTIDRPASQKFGIEHVPSERKDFSITTPISTGNNSGHQALGLVSSMGFDEIILLGYDFKCVEKRHWFGEHPDGLRDKYQMYDMWIEDMRKARPVLDDAGICVINCSPDSDLDAFERASLRDIM